LFSECGPYRSATKVRRAGFGNRDDGDGETAEVRSVIFTHVLCLSVRFFYSQPASRRLKGFIRREPPPYPAWGSYYEPLPWLSPQTQPQTLNFAAIDVADLAVHHEVIPSRYDFLLLTAGTYPYGWAGVALLPTNGGPYPKPKPQTLPKMQHSRTAANG
jgi:hypothetical protein